MDAKLQQNCKTAHFLSFFARTFHMTFFTTEESTKREQCLDVKDYGSTFLLNKNEKVCKNAYSNATDKIS